MFFQIIPFKPTQTVILNFLNFSTTLLLRRFCIHFLGDRKYVGIPCGRYVRIVISKIPAEFVLHFNPKIPILMGGLLPHETTVGYTRMRFKKHRWHTRILKSHDPLVLSIGWRRYV